MTQQDQEQRIAEAQWALAQCIRAQIDSKAIAILAYECGFNATDIKHITQSLKETA